MSEEVIDVTITEDWLKSVGFKWHNQDRQPHKHWLLWLGGAVDKGRYSCTSDLGIEVTPTWWLNHKGERVGEDAWHCWLRSDLAHRYCRFIHIRHVCTTTDIIGLVEAITGLPWKPENHFYGQVLTDERAEYCRREEQRLDRVLLHAMPKHNKAEQDDTRDGALPEHLEEWVKQGKEVEPNGRLG